MGLLLYVSDSMLLTYACKSDYCISIPGTVKPVLIKRPRLGQKKWSLNRGG